MRLSWNKINVQTKAENDYCIRFSQLKRNSKTKKTQYLAIYNDRIQYFKDPEYKNLHGEILFTFKLTIEWLYLGKINSIIKLPPLIGFKLWKGNESLSFYIGKEKILEQIQKYLSKFLLQKNIHYYYKLIRKIGKGGFASVYLVQNRIDGRYYAAKIFLKQKQKTAESKTSVKKEIITLRLLDHENLLSLKETFVTENSIYIITEYCSGPTLEGYISSNNCELTKDEISRIMKQQLEGLAYLHSLGIMHRDLKPANILFTSNECSNLVIADFGLAQKVSAEEYLFPRAGTPGYAAPEVANNIEKLSNYSESCDIFSMGCILYLIATGKKLFQGRGLKEILAVNKECQIDFQNEQFDKIDPEIKEVLVVLLEKNPKERISAKEILKFSLFNQKLQKEIFTNNSLKTNSNESIDLLAKLEKVSDFSIQQIDYIKKTQQQESTKFLNIVQEKHQISIEQFF